MAAIGTNLSVTGRLHNAFGRPIYQRCTEIAQLLEDTSTKELLSILPVLLEAIFGFGSQPGWGLGRISRSQGNEFTAIIKLLAPDGPLLKLVYKLCADPFVKFEFPFTCLPMGSRKLIEEGSLPVLYADKLQFNPAGKPYSMLSLDAFEYYFFHFTYFLVNPNTNKSSSSSNPSDSLYPMLIEQYLNYFLPLNGSGGPPPVLQHSPPQSPTPNIRSPMSAMASPGRSNMMSSPMASRSPYSSLLRTHTQSPRQSFMAASTLPSSPAHHQHDTEPRETHRSTLFVQILMDFWLNQCSVESDRFTLSQQTASSFHHAQEVSWMDPYQYIWGAASFLPGGDHIRAVRMVIKHLHYFANSARSETIMSPYSTAHGQPPWEEFKRNVISQYVQKKIYIFLRHTFERWPLDASFRLILETWLSYIQPWRYTNPTQSNREKELEAKDRLIEEKWRPFVVENLLFYSSLLQQFMTRCARMDLSSPKNAYMLFRATKVFALPRLRDMLDDAEAVLFESSHPMPVRVTDLGGSYLSSNHCQNYASAISIHIVELEGPQFKYTPLFCQHTCNTVQQLLRNIRQARSTASGYLGEPAGGSSSSNDSGLMGLLGFGPMMDYNASRFMSSPGGDYEEYGGGGDVRKLEGHLEQSAANLANIFQIEPEEDEKRVTWGSDGKSPVSAASSYPDVTMDEDGVKLTPLGRYQLMNRLKKFDIGYKGDPDLQPIRSFENKMLVRMLHSVTTYISNTYGDLLEELYYDESFIGKLSQQVLSIPWQPPSPKLGPAPPLSKQPRLRLRWMANYQNIGFFLALYILTWLWFGCGPMTYTFVLLGLAFIWVSFKALRAMYLSATSKVKTT